MKFQLRFILIGIVCVLFVLVSSKSSRGEVYPKAAEGGGHSVAPLAGYNNTYGVFFGAAYGYQSDFWELLVVGMATFVDSYKGDFNMRMHLSDHLDLVPYLSGAAGFEPYFGRNGEIPVEGQIDDFGKKLESKLALDWKLTDHFVISPFYRYQYWKEKGQRGHPGRSFIPNEASHGVGLTVANDFLEKHDGIQEGWRLENTATLLPATLDNPTVAIESIFRLYVPLFKKLTFANRFSLGITTGEPTFFTSYRLGGTERLRGYHTNRFVGRHYYLTQHEIHFPIWGHLTGVGFVDQGEARDRSFEGPLFSWGGGLRFALPPDEVAIIRLDVGVGQDEVGAIIDFGQAF